MTPLRRSLLTTMLLLVACGPRTPPLASPFGRTAWHETVREATVEEARVIDRVEALFKDGAEQEAEAAIDQAIASGLDHPRLFMIRAQNLLARGRTEEAIPWLDRALAVAPGLVEPRVLLVNAYLEVERPVAAESVCTEIDRLFPEHPAGPYGRGLCRLRRGDSDGARGFLDTALERDCDYPPALLARAAVAGLDGNHDLQQQLLQAYVSLVTDDPQAYATLGDLAQERGLLKESERYFRRSWELRPSGMTAGRLADLARLRHDEAGETFWRSRQSDNSR